MLRVMLVFPPSVLIFSVLIVLFVISAYVVWRESRIGYILSAIVSGIFLSAEGVNATKSVSSVTIPGDFVSAVVAISASAAVLVYSILGARITWNKSLQARPMKMIPASSFVILLLLGFVCGSFFVGYFAAGTENMLISSSANHFDETITIVSGAWNPKNGQFYSPENLTVKVGTIVTWVNLDGTPHSVASKGSNLINSPEIPTGGNFSYTFTQPGTFTYYCTLHPWMTGTIVVTGS